MTNARLLMLAAFVSALSLGLFLWIGRLLEKRRAALEKRLRGQGTGSDSDIALGSASTPRQGWRERLDRAFDRMIQRTGMEVDSGQALALIALVGVALAAALFFWRGELWLSILGLTLGGGGTLMAFLILQRRYRRQLSEQLPDAFYLLSRSLRAGLSLEQAIALTGEQGAKPLAGEFHRCAAQLELGLAIPSALELVARRIQLLDFNVFVTTVSLYYTMGGNLAMLLDRLAASTRDRNQFRGYFRTATALSRVTAIAIGLMTPLLLLIYALYPPEHARAFFESPDGWAAMAVAGLLQIIGIVWLYRLLRVDY
ncbi:MAG: type II secretion system F family protein [Gemmataceae bacterium]